MNGFVKLHRQLTEWEWYQDMNVKATFLHLLLTVNFKDKRWKGIPIKRGQILTSLQHLATDIGFSVQKLRTALDKLEGTGEITREATSLYTMITLCNFDSYQDKDSVSNKPITSEQQTDNKRITNEQQLLKNVKKVKKDKNEENKESKETPSQIEFLESENQKLKEENLILKNQEEKGKEKSSEKKEKRTFPDNAPRKSYTVEVPQTESQNSKPYQVFLNNYPFDKKGWSEGLKQIFLTYCEVKDENSHRGYSSTQMKLRIAEINQAIEKHEMEWIEKLVTSGANGGWADFQFDERIKARKLKQKKDEAKQAANNGKSIYENYADMLNKNSNNDDNDTIDVSWAEA